MAKDSSQLYDLYNQYMQPKLILAERLDAAYELYQRLDLQDTFYKELQPKLEQFLKTILNVDKMDDVASLMQDRLKRKSVDVEYIPNRIPKIFQHVINPLDAPNKAQSLWRQTALVGLFAQRNKLLSVNPYMQEEDEDDEVEMLPPIERDKNRIIISGGQFLQRQSDNTFEPYDTEDNVSHDMDGVAAFLITRKGEMLLFDRVEEMDDEDKVYAHSSYNEGATVMMAGEIQIEDGKLVSLGTHSGHYKPKLENVVECLKYFKEQGVDVSQTLIYGLADRNQDVKHLKLDKAPVLVNYTAVFKASDLLDHFSQKAKATLPDAEAPRMKR